jgi:WD40-like Beta Propeller Repeat
MFRDVSLAELFRAGLVLAPYEAVAIVQQLIEGQYSKAALASDDAPHVHPRRDDVELRRDGSVVCRSCNGVPTVPQMAELLRALLPRASHLLEDELKHVIEDASVHGDSDSLEQFSESLRPFEWGPPRQIVRELLEAIDTGRLRHSQSVDQRLPDEMQFIELEGLSGLEAFLPETPTAAPKPPALPPEVDTLGAAERSEPGGDREDGDSIDSSAWRNVDEESSRLGWQEAATVAALAAAIGAGSFFLTLRQSATNQSIPVTAASSLQAGADNASAKGTTEQSALVIPRPLPGFSPAFARRGSAVFFHTGGRGAHRSDLAMAEVDGGKSRVVTILSDGARNYHVQPSPDGRLIAFDSDRDGERGVYVASRDGSNEKRITGRGYAAVPTWAPDGKRIAFVRAEPGRPNVWNLWLLSLESGAVRRLTQYRYGQTWGASWFPGGDRIAYTHETKIIVKNLMTGVTREFDSPIANRLVRTAAVSLDGTRVIFQVFRDGAWLLNLADGSMRRVFADPTAEEFAWAPDGGRVAFHSRRDGRWRIRVAALSR